MKTQGDKFMESIVSIVFGLGVIMIIASVFIYSKKDMTTADETLQKIASVEADNKYLKTLITSMQSSDVSIAERVVKIEGELLHLKNDRTECDSEVKELKESCDKLKKSQIELQEKLSNKRPVIYVKHEPEPKKQEYKSEIAVDLLEKNGLGIDALLKPRGKKAKQVDGTK